MKHLLLVLLLITMVYSQDNADSISGLHINSSFTVSTTGKGFDLYAEGDTYVGFIFGILFDTENDSTEITFNPGIGIRVTNELRITTSIVVSKRDGTGPSIGMILLPLASKSITPVISIKQGLLFKEGFTSSFTSISLGIGFGRTELSTQ